MSQAAIAVQDIRRAAAQPFSMIEQANRLLGVRAVKQEPLPGKPDNSQRLHLENGKSLIATRRKYTDRVDPECLILESFTAHRAPVPRLLAKNRDGLFLQQDLRGPSVAQKLRQQGEHDYADILVPALKNLAKLHRVGSHDHFEKKLPLIGDSEEWRREFIHYPAKLGASLGIKPKAPDIDALLELFSVRQPRFIKWNARPINAKVVKEQVYWTDWERAAVRQRLDDMVWFLGDETLPERPDDEARLVKAFLPYFADGLGEQDAQDYFYAFGALHISVRLGVILRHKKKEAWRDAKTALANPEVGLHKPWVSALCQRGQRWSAQSQLTASLESWFKYVGKSFDSM